MSTLYYLGSFEPDNGSDGLALNLGPEDWQTAQAKSAFNVLASLPHKTRLRLFLSLDCMVLPTTSLLDGQKLLGNIADLIKQPMYLQYRGRPLLSTFGGESAAFGGSGWEGWLRDLTHTLGNQVCLLSWSRDRDLTRCRRYSSCLPFSSLQRNLRT